MGDGAAAGLAFVEAFCVLLHRWQGQCAKEGADGAFMLSIGRYASLIGVKGW